MLLTGEIIHNPHVNDQLRAQDIRFLTDPGRVDRRADADDVVILPAFGVTIELLGSSIDVAARSSTRRAAPVLNVWKNVNAATRLTASPR